MRANRSWWQQRAIFVLGITFVGLLISAGVRSAPSVLMLPLQAHFGWDRATISATSAVGIVLSFRQ